MPYQRRRLNLPQPQHRPVDTGWLASVMAAPEVARQQSKAAAWQGLSDLPSDIFGTVQQIQAYKQAQQMAPIQTQLLQSQVEAQKALAQQRLQPKFKPTTTKKAITPEQALELGEYDPEEYQVIRETVKSQPAQMLFRVQNAFNSDPNVRKAQQSINSVGSIQDFALSGNPIAHNAIPTYSARMSGEVGNLSEPDKVPFGGSLGLVQRIDRFVNRWASGKLDATDLKFITDFTNVVEKRANENLKDMARKRSKQFSKTIKGFSEQEIYEALSPGTIPTTPPRQEIDTSDLGFE